MDIGNINEFKLSNAPNDCIQSVKFCKQSNDILLAASWDGSVRIYDVQSNKLCNKFDHPEPVLDAVFQDTNRIWSGCFDKKLRVYDAYRNQGHVFGSHLGAIRCVDYSPELNIIISGSFDGNVMIWDPRQQTPVGTYPQPEKVYAMDYCDTTLVVATADRKVLIWDLKNMSFAQQRRDSSLKYQTRSIKCFSNREGFVQGSIEGRVAVEYFDPSPEIQKKKYAFKCHRSKDAQTGMETIYPVNAISFHSGHNTFATGGSDCMVNIWDAARKKRLCQLHKFPASISSLAFSPSGTTLAIASSCLYENPLEKDAPPDAVYIRHLSDSETRPK